MGRRAAGLGASERLGFSKEGACFTKDVRFSSQNEVYFLYFNCCELSSWSCHSFLHWCQKVESCDFRAGAAKVFFFLHMYWKVPTAKPSCDHVRSMWLVKVTAMESRKIRVYSPRRLCSEEMILISLIGST